MWPGGKFAKRFSYLLLQDGEHYVQDWIATCVPPAGGGARMQMLCQQLGSFKGRLRLCSKSVFFEPDDAGIPILMFPLNKVSRIEQVSDSSRSAPKLAGVQIQRTAANAGFILEASLLVKMKKNGVDAPYEFDKAEGVWWFCLDYAPVQQFVQQAQSLLSVNSLSPPERDMILRNTAAQKEAQAQFDISRLEDFTEEMLFNYPAAQMTPLVREPGRLVLTANRLYFQPLHNLNNHTPVRSHKLRFIVALARRRHSLQHIGLEVFFKDVNSFTKSTAAAGFVDGGSAFFAFASAQHRDDAVNKLLQELQGQTGFLSSVGSLLDKNGSWLDRATAAWQAGHISNYDYLMYLNMVAGRTLCDLAQWPVMPWVLKDYESTTLNLNDPKTFRDLTKPVGALNPSRLSVFKERFGQMSKDSHAPFLYGTHYSTPGYVLYWLVRAAPAHMLRLQNGRFDMPDRLFFSIAESWHSVLTNHADVKELIPEFYALPSTFLVSRADLNLGVRQDGVHVRDVILPPWAKDSDDFIIKHRRSLECKHVSMNIQNWIDLIFGYKQQGEEAAAADNVFHQLTYEGAVNLESVEDPFERMSLEAQINEFGQAPQQLFTGPHPSGVAFEKVYSFEEHKQSMLEADAGSLCAAILSRIMAQTVSFEGGIPEQVQDVPVPAAASGEENQISEPEEVVSQEAVSLQSHSDYEVEESEQTEVPYFGTPFGECSTPHTPQLDVKKFRHSRLHSRKNLELLFLPTEAFKDQRWKLKRVTESQPWRIHREPVNAVIVSDENASESVTLYSASKGGLIKVYSLSEGFQVRATKLGILPISSLALASSSDAYPTVLAGSYDNCVYAYSVDYGRSLGKIRVHDDSVSCVRVTGSKMVTASWDATVKIWSLDEGRGGWLNSGSTSEADLIEHEAAIWSLDLGLKGDIIASGAEDGTVILWDVRARGSPIWTSKELTAAASAMRLSADEHQLLVASTSGCLYALEVRRGGSVLSQKNCETPIRSCDIVEDVLVAGSFNGELHFWSWKLDDPGGSCEPPLRNHSDAINCIGIGSKHGAPVSVATASEDCTIQVYNIDRSRGRQRK